MKVVFIISPGTHFLDLAGPDQVFFEAIYYKAPIELVYCSWDEHADTASGLRFAQLPHFSGITVEKGDYVLIPGMDAAAISGARQAALAPLHQWLRDAWARQVNLCSVCTGAFLLAQTGLLNGLSCTTHWKYTKRLQQQFPLLKVQENVLYTEQNRILTSAGIASGIDLALHIVEKEFGPHLANKVAREIVVYIRRDGGQEQQSVFLSYRNHLHAGIHAVQDWLTEHLSERNTLDQLAQVANMSIRNFTRTFRKETGISPGEYLLRLRRETARELLKKPDLSRRQIAAMIGLESERQLRRIM